MKTYLQIMIGIMLVAIWPAANAQINFSENFGNGAQLWTGSGFEATDIADCSGNGSIRARVNRAISDRRQITAVSPLLGVSDGREVTLNYSIRLLAYDAVLPQHALPDSDFGRITIETAASASGPWNVLDRIDISNFLPTADCNSFSVNFTPPLDERLYIRFTAIPGTAINTDYFLYVDEISAIQGAVVENMASTALASAYINPGDSYLHVAYPAPVDEWALFDMQGQQVVVRDIDGNGARLDISGLAFGNYVLKLRMADKIETVNIVKK